MYGLIFPWSDQAKFISKSFLQELMPTHLQDYDIEALALVQSSYKWLSENEHRWHQAEGSKLETIHGREIRNLKPLFERARAKLSPEVRMPRWESVYITHLRQESCGWGIFLSKEVRPISHPSIASYIIPISMSDRNSYLSREMNEDAQGRVLLEPGHAYFCAAGEPAFITAGVIFFVLSPIQSDHIQS